MLYLGEEGGSKRSCRALLDLPIYSQGAVHSSPSLPTPSPHPLLDDNFDPIGRVRVASISRRSIRSTAVGLVIGEESSSEEEEGEEDGTSTGEGVRGVRRVRG